MTLRLPEISVPILLLPLRAAHTFPASLQLKALNLLKYKQFSEGNTVSMISHLHLRSEESFLRIH